MAPIFHPDQLHRMFQAFDLARKVSPDDPDTIADRIINAASLGAATVDELFAAALHPHAARFTDGARKPRIDSDSAD